MPLIEIYGILCAGLNKAGKIPNDTWRNRADEEDIFYLESKKEEMPRGGIEPPTPAFSVLCSTD